MNSKGLVPTVIGSVLVLFGGSLIVRGENRRKIKPADNTKIAKDARNYLNWNHPAGYALMWVGIIILAIGVMHMTSEDNKSYSNEQEVQTPIKSSRI